MQPQNNRSVLLLGGVLVDRCFQVEQYPESGQDTVIERAFERIGGCALNVAVTLNNLGSTPYIVSKLGDDDTGARIEQYITSLSLPTAYVYKEQEKKTGYCLVITDRTGQRTFFTDKGCEAEFPGVKWVADAVEAIKSVYVTGYYLLNTETAAAVIEVVEQLRRKGCRAFFDPGPLVGSIDVSQLLKMISLTDWMIPNSVEIEIIQKKVGCVAEPISWLQGQGCHHVVVKKGAQGVDIYSDDITYSIEGFRVNSIDTNGAGDSFAGGLIHALATDYPIKRAIEFASACGAFTTTFEGSHGVYSSTEIGNFLMTQKVKIRC